MLFTAPCSCMFPGRLSGKCEGQPCQAWKVSQKLQHFRWFNTGFVKPKIGSRWGNRQKSHELKTCELHLHICTLVHVLNMWKVKRSLLVLTLLQLMQWLDAQMIMWLLLVINDTSRHNSMRSGNGLITWFRFHCMDQQNCVHLISWVSLHLLLLCSELTLIRYFFVVREQFWDKTSPHEKAARRFSLWYQWSVDRRSDIVFRASFDRARQTIALKPVPILRTSPEPLAMNSKGCHFFQILTHLNLQKNCHTRITSTRWLVIWKLWKYLRHNSAFSL